MRAHAYFIEYSVVSLGMAANGDGDITGWILLSTLNTLRNVYVVFAEDARDLDEEPLNRSLRSDLWSAFD